MLDVCLGGSKLGMQGLERYFYQNICFNSEVHILNQYK